MTIKLESYIFHANRAHKILALNIRVVFGVMV